MSARMRVVLFVPVLGGIIGATNVIFGVFGAGLDHISDNAFTTAAYLFLQILTFASLLAGGLCKSPGARSFGAVSIAVTFGTLLGVSAWSMMAPSPGIIVVSCVGVVWGGTVFLIGYGSREKKLAMLLGTLCLALTVPVLTDMLSTLLGGAQICYQDSRGGYWDNSPLFATAIGLTAGIVAGSLLAGAYYGIAQVRKSP